MSTGSGTCRSTPRALLTTAIALQLAACAPSYVATQTRPAASLLQECQEPALVPDPDAATRQELQVEKVRLARAFADCRDQNHALIQWVVGMAGPATPTKGSKP